MSYSRAERFAELPEAERSAILSKMSDADKAALYYAWEFWGRPEQFWPTERYWSTWLLLAGRGFGKTRTGAEAIRNAAFNKYTDRMALVGATYADVRDVMLEGDSGLLRVSPPNFMPVVRYNRRLVEWPNGVVAFIYTAEEPERLRGPQHGLAWGDEIAAWQYSEAWDQLQFGLRIGKDPRVIATTTPKPTKLIKDLVADPTTYVTTGTTYDNVSNLANSFFSKIVRRYEGTRLGRQELQAEILNDVPGALWNSDMIEKHRAKRSKDVPAMARVVVAVDPAVTSGENANETGIIVAGRGSNGHGYVFGDYSERYTPPEWARKVNTALAIHQGDRIVGETNNGGDLVEANIRTVNRTTPFKKVHASRGKYVRAEPIASLYEQGLIHHVGTFPILEQQMCMFTPDMDRSVFGSPDRVDALVWGLTELFPVVNGGNLQDMVTL